MLKTSRTNGLGGLLVAILALGSTALNMQCNDPPRYDGAGYAVLARSLMEGRGLREIDHPDAPRHAHFPPLYPLVLAGIWSLAGPSICAAHVASIGFTVLATVAGWAWFRTMYAPRVAFLMGAALAVNWSWGRIGGSIQSEPLYLFLEMVTMLAATRFEVSRRGTSDILQGIGLGLLLGVCILTRHVAICLALAVLADLAISRRVASITAIGLSAMLVVLPWAAWLIAVGQRTQVHLLPKFGINLVILSNAVFYIRRIPDLVVGPVVEIGTVFRPGWTVPATAFAVLATALVGFGWWRASRTPRRRLASRAACASLALLLIWPFTEAGRFLIPLLPMILVAVVEGLAGLLPRSKSRRSRAVAASVLLVVSLPYSIHAVFTARADAARQTHADFDHACAWIAANRDHPGPVLGRHPGEIYWQTGRTALSPPADDPEAIGRLIDRYGVAFLLIDDDRYARAPTSPLGRFTQLHPERVDPARRFGPIEVFVVRRP